MSTDRPAASPKWFEEFFEGLAADIWRSAATPELTDAEAAMVADLFDLDQGDRLLDVPCGEGRVAVELAARGYAVTGVDLSSQAIRKAEASRQARAELEGEALALDLAVRDMRDLPWRGAFRGVYCLGNAFGYFDRAGSADFLAAVARTLQPRGHFLLHSAMAAESFLPNYEDEVEITLDGLKMRAENRYDALAGRLDTRYTFTRGAEREERMGVHWIYSVAETAAMLERAGLHTLALFGDAEGTPFSVGAPELYLLAEKA